MDYQTYLNKGPLDDVINFAASCCSGHYAFGRPLRGQNEGFNEANIAHHVSAAFRAAGFLVFPEFPISTGGSIDAIFIRNEEIVICELKQCYPEHFCEIVSQSERMLKFDPKNEFFKNGFPEIKWKLRRLWVCDAWDEPSANWFFGKNIEKKPVSPFNNQWKYKGEHKFNGANLANYSWVWTYTDAEYTPT